LWDNKSAFDQRDEFKIVILTVPSKFLLPSPVKLCGTEVKAAKTGRLCDYREEETKVSWVITALNVCRCRPEENNVQGPSCPMFRDIRKNTAYFEGPKLRPQSYW
jgi:hypothetical protein